MYIKILVEQDVQNGRKLVEALQKRLPISAAFWLNSEEANEWRFVIVSPLVSAGDARLAYHMVEHALAETGVPIPLAWISTEHIPPKTRASVELRLQDGLQAGMAFGRRSGP